jgi:hypothetical protein
MLENLQKGREKLREINMQKRKIKEEEAKKPKVKEIYMVKDPKRATKKYIIQPKKKHIKKREQPEEEEIASSSSEEEAPTDTTDAEDVRVRRKVEKKVKAIKDIDDKIKSLSNNMFRSKYGNLFQ